VKIVEHVAGEPAGILLFGLLYINFSLRAGKAFYLAPDCDEVIFPDKVIHCCGIYVQIWKLGGNIMFRSSKCLEKIK
jgi:hypothetical protein